MKQKLAPFLAKKLTLKDLEIIILDLPQKEVFRSGIGIRKSRKALIVKWVDEENRVGYGECSCRPDPYYSSEFIEGASLLIQQFIRPFIPSSLTFGDLLKVLSKVRGWNFTKTAVEAAAHDLIAKRDDENLFDYAQLPQLEAIPAGISIGIQTAEEMIETVKKADLSGYRRLKFKTSPDIDPEHFTPIFEQYKDRNISFDANGTFQEGDISLLSKYTRFSTALEQPFPPGRIDFYQKAIKEIPDLKICPDEEAKSIGDVIKLHQLGAMDELNLKLGRVGGLYNSLEIVDYCLKNNILCWIGGMFETGIGRSLNIQLAATLHAAKAHDLSPSQRYFHEDVLVKPIEMDNNGMVNVASAQEAVVDPEIIEKYRIR